MAELFECQYFVFAYLVLFAAIGHVQHFKTRMHFANSQGVFELGAPDVQLGAVSLLATLDRPQWHVTILVGHPFQTSTIGIGQHLVLGQTVLLVVVRHKTEAILVMDLEKLN